MEWKTVEINLGQWHITRGLTFVAHSICSHELDSKTSLAAPERHLRQLYPTAAGQLQETIDSVIVSISLALSILFLLSLSFFLDDAEYCPSSL